MRTGQAIVSAALVNQLGAMMSFAALMMFAQDRGSQWTALCFLVLAVPPIVWAKPLAQRAARHNVAHGWLTLNIGLAALAALTAAVAPRIVYVVLIMAVIAILRAATSALLSSLVSVYVPETQRPETFTQLGSVSALTLIIGPLFSAFLYSPLGISGLYLLNAATYVIATGCVIWATRRPETTTPNTNTSPHNNYRSTATTWPVMWLWGCLGITGILFDVAEFPLFDRVAPGNTTYFGIAMAAYGLGGGLAFVFAKQLSTHTARWWLAPLIYALGLTCVLTLQHTILLIGMTIMGFGYGYFNGWLRLTMDQECTKHALEPVTFWSHATRIILIANATVGGCALWYYTATNNGSPLPLAWLSLGSTFILLMSCIWFQKHHTQRRNSTT